MKYSKDILVIGATHGDEPIGVEVMKECLKEVDIANTCDFIIGNPLALEQHVRFVDYDLNRAAPGDKKALVWEKRRAAELIAISNDYKYTIDVHGSNMKNGIFIIVTNPTEENLRLAALFTIPRIIILPSVIPDLVDPVSKYFPCGLEIESGPKSSPAVHAKLQEYLADFLTNYRERESVDTRTLLQDREIYEVYGALLENPDGVELGEFKQVEIRGEEFHALFVGSYDYCSCLKMRQCEYGDLKL